MRGTDVSLEFVPRCFQLTNNCLSTLSLSQTPDDTAGSTLLQVLDRFALNNHDTSQQPMSNSANIGMTV